jgi:aldehyde:ferredoxin oxidoreductase
MLCLLIRILNPGLWGGKSSANVGGFWGAELKYAGYDNIIIIGKSEKPVYLYINDSHIEIRDANLIWGKTIFETENILRQELSDNDIKIASIGLAGENRVRGSAIIIDTAKAAGGSGVGCVMGDKRLKAIVVRGHGKIEVAEPERFMKVVAKCYQQCKDEPNTEMMHKAPLNLYEPFRVPKGWALAVSTSPVAGRHLRGATMGSNRYGPKPRPGNFEVTDYQNQAKGVVWQGKTKELEDNLGICNYVGTWSGANFLTIADFAELINAGMGLDLTEEELMNHHAVIGRNLEKAFNTLHTDMSRKDDLPPKRFREEEVKSGPYKGFKIEENKYNEMLDEFYELWGWDKKTGMQTRTGLEKLGLKDVAEKIAKQGKLIDK